MKINWGTSIVIAFIGFISFILFFVVKMSTDNRANHDLVTEEYYKAELGYQKEINATVNANKINIKILKTSEGLSIQFPSDIEKEQIKGTVFLYRPSNKHLDFDLLFHLSNSHLLIPDKRLLDGRWNIKILWEHNGTEFLYKENITYIK